MLLRGLVRRIERKGEIGNGILERRGSDRMERESYER
jgi:hypothetical protein